MYAELPGYEELRGVLSGKLAEYNETNTSMDLVLFQQASNRSLHHLRIGRTLCLENRTDILGCPPRASRGR